jgi:hypothetical protein
MKLPFITPVLLLFTVRAAAQLLETSQLTLVLQDPSDSPLLFSRAMVTATFQPAGEFAINEEYRIGNDLEFTMPSGRFLKNLSGRTDFTHGAVIEESLPIYVEPSHVGKASLSLKAYVCRMLQPGDHLRTANIADFFPNQTDVFIGFTVKYNDFDHFGWVHMRRPVIDIITIFTPVASALHPVSGEPIRAGLPPELPPVNAVIDPVTDTLQIAWPSSFPGVRLERTDSLDAPVVWTPVETPLSNAISLPLSVADQLYFRLQYVP